MKSLALATVATALAVESTYAIDFGGNKVQQNVQGTGNNADVAVQNLVSNAMLFLGIVAVLYGIWGGFLMVTAGGDEEKVKKGRTILVQVAIGLVVIFLANSIVQFVLTQILKP